VTDLTFYRKFPPFEADEPHKWTAEDGREIALFAAQCLAIVALAILLYAVGPAVGLALVAGTMAVWAAIRRSAQAKDETTDTQAGEARHGGRPLWHAM